MSHVHRCAKIIKYSWAVPWYTTSTCVPIITLLSTLRELCYLWINYLPHLHYWLPLLENLGTVKLNCLKHSVRDFLFRLFLVRLFLVRLFLVRLFLVRLSLVASSCLRQTNSTPNQSFYFSNCCCCFFFQFFALFLWLIATCFAV